MYCRASGVSGGGALADGPTGEGSSPRRLVIQAPASSARVPTDTPVVACAYPVASFFCASTLNMTEHDGLLEAASMCRGPCMQSLCMTRDDTI